jgi:hypothetical protein
MSESITVRGAAIPDAMTSAQITALLNQILTDVANLRIAMSNHTHVTQVNSVPAPWTSNTTTYTQSATNLLP